MNACCVDHGADLGAHVTSLLVDSFDNQPPPPRSHIQNSTMEAVGFAASICSLLEFLEKVIAYIKDTKGTNEERHILIKELVSTKIVLSELENKANLDEWKVTMEALMTKNGPQDQFKSLLERLDKKLSPSGGKLLRVAQSLTGHFAKELSQLERLKSLFILALENKHM